MTPTTITILAVAAYFAVGYGASIWAYSRQLDVVEAFYRSKGLGEKRWESVPMRPGVVAATMILVWLPCLVWCVATIPHRYFAALVKKLNTPAPVQVSGAFAGERPPVPCATLGWRTGATPPARIKTVPKVGERCTVYGYDYICTGVEQTADGLTLCKFASKASELPRDPL
jgi:hypothetical protein